MENNLFINLVKEHHNMLTSQVNQIAHVLALSHHKLSHLFLLNVYLTDLMPNRIARLG